MAHKFDHKKMSKLDSPQRRLEIPPLKILEVLGLTKGNIVADVGCGIGYFSIPAANIAGDAAIVYALDISQEMLDEVEKKSVELGISNIRTIKTSEYELTLDDCSVDFIIMSLVLHEVENKIKMMDEITRILKAGGIFSMIEWEEQPGASGPPSQERISFKEISALLSEKGYCDINKYVISENFYGVTARKL
ncbi:MAG: class I SAM-dependent methyltransferase [Peptostreptococcaceae bacterium]|nr:class I SAM-dependent methyltransferase [Peptostreptococcaceae bacterium]